ncbi:MAG: tetratricopeptide repeat protein [Deltaproteobacteria bacterium]|nr:tetratricopeptide repeat protein [Deltaproteobacteria bacterium]MCW5803967.1 tetratricopeptide repeat protein [Deltaproteobacteria bacterium]
MSVSPLRCDACDRECTFDHAGPFPPGQEGSYGVAWQCPSCQRRALDVCSIGPLIPVATTCVNCGGERGAGECPDCGLTEVQVRAVFGIDGAITVERAIADAQRGLLRRALAHCNWLLARAPSTELAWRLKGEICQQLGFHTATARMLLHAAEVANAPVLLFSAALSLQELGRNTEAVAVYRELLAWAPEAPNAPLAWSNLGNALSALGRRDEADRAHARALAREPAHSTIAFNYVHHLQQGERWLESLGILEHALRFATDASTRVAFLFSLSRAHAELENGASALDAADAAVALDEHSIGARFMRGRALCLLGRLHEGMAEMQHVLALDPGNRDAANAVRILERAGVTATMPS